MNDERIGRAAALRARVSPRRWRVSFGSSSKGTISGSIAKDVFDKMFASGRTADDIVVADGLTQIDDASTILTLIDGVLSQAPGRRRPVSGRQDVDARVSGRPGDEGDRGRGEPETRQ